MQALQLLPDGKAQPPVHDGSSCAASAADPAASHAPPSGLWAASSVQAAASMPRVAVAFCKIVTSRQMRKMYPALMRVVHVIMLQVRRMAAGQGWR